MKAYNQIKPDDAEVLRNGKWIRYDASSLVEGDILRLEEGDMIPADCVALGTLEDPNTSLLVDVRAITGEDKPRSFVDVSPETDGLLQLYWGGTVVQGSCHAVVTAVGPNTLVSKLIKEGTFPPVVSKKAITDANDEHDEEAGVSLMASKNVIS
jgi:magnesium-transporting ATPase (P-type)